MQTVEKINSFLEGLEEAVSSKPGNPSISPAPKDLPRAVDDGGSASFPQFYAAPESPSLPSYQVLLDFFLAR